MKRIGILYGKDSKKLFLLPNEIKSLVAKGINVTVPSGIGSCVSVADSELSAAGAKVVPSWMEVIKASDILLKVDAFNKAEIEQIGNKIAITMANYLNNVEMIYHMLVNKTTGLEWNSLANKGEYLFFPELEELKAPHVLKLLQDAIAKGLAKKEKDKVIYPKNPKLLILNATYNGVALAQLAIKAGFDVTIADNDTKYLTELRKTAALSKLCAVDANYETLVELVKRQNCFVVTATDPTNLARTRITKNMAETMPKGSLLIDAGCEYGYAFQFIKRYVDKELKWNKIEKSFYLAHEDLTNLSARQASEIISKKSLNYLIDLAQDGLTRMFDSIIVCQTGKVVSRLVNSKLRLY